MHKIKCVIVLDFSAYILYRHILAYISFYKECFIKYLCILEKKITAS